MLGIRGLSNNDIEPKKPTQRLTYDLEMAHDQSPPRS